MSSWKNDALILSGKPEGCTIDKGVRWRWWSVIMGANPGGYPGYSPSKNLSGGAKYRTRPTRKWWNSLPPL